MRVRVKPFTVDVDPAVWRKHFGEMSLEQIRVEVQQAAEGWLNDYIAELTEKAKAQ